MDILEIIKNRRSIRKFNEKDVSKEDLKKIVEAGIFAPTGMNREEVIIYAVTNRELNEMAEMALEEATGSAGKAFYNSPVIIHVCAKKDSFNALPDIACVMENMWLMASCLNYGAVWVNGLRRNSENEKVKDLFNKIGIPEDYMVYASLALGNTDEEIHFIKEKNKKTVFIE